MTRKAQGSLEYILLLGAVLFLIIMAVIITRTNILLGGAEKTQSNVQQWNTTIESMCNVGVPCPAGYACYQANGSCLLNLIGNPGFEQDLSVNWSGESPPEIIRVNDTRKEGTWSLLLNETTNQGAPVLNSQCYVNSDAGNFVFSAKAKASGGYARADVIVYSESTCSGSSTVYDANTSSTSWTTLTREFSMPANAGYKVHLSCNAYISCDDAWFDDLALYRVS